MMSFKDKLGLYLKKSTVQPCLQDTSILAGTSTLDKLTKLYKARLSTEMSPSFPSSTSPRETIVICLVIVDKLHHEEIWRHWMEKGSIRRVKTRLLIHAKHPEKVVSEWVKAHTIKESFTPEWNSIEVVRALLALLEEGLTDTTSARFLFGTESCIPLYSAEHICKTLLSDDKSWACVRHRPESKWEAACCFHAVDPEVIPPEAVWKALPGWILMSWRHAYEIVTLTKIVSPCDLVSSFGSGGPWKEGEGVFAPEEVFFPTMLALLGYLRDEIFSISSSAPKEVLNQAVTYAEWPRRGDANPVQFNRLDVSLLKRLRSTGALFSRKFGPESCDLTTWVRVLSSPELAPTEWDNPLMDRLLTIQNEGCLITPRNLIFQSNLQTHDRLVTKILNVATAVEEDLRLTRANIKITVLMIIIDDLPHEAIWRLWAQLPVASSSDQSERLPSTDSILRDKARPGNGSTTTTPTSLTINQEGSMEDNPNEEMIDTRVPPCEVRFLIHAKHPDRVRSPWVRERLAKTFQARPEWGSVQVTEVMVNLLKEAVETDPPSEAFCFCSESCIPACSLSEFTAALQTNQTGAYSKTWLNHTRQPNNGFAKEKQFDILHLRWPKECLAKADQWIMISQAHAIAVLDLPRRLGCSVLALFETMSASDEMYFPCCLSLLGLLTDDSFQSRQSIEENSHGVEFEHDTSIARESVSIERNMVLKAQRRQLTYCVWPEGARSPTTFGNLTNELLQEAKSARCLFLRKVILPTSVATNSNEAVIESRLNFFMNWNSLVIQPMSQSSFNTQVLLEAQARSILVASLPELTLKSPGVSCTHAINGSGLRHSSSDLSYGDSSRRKGNPHSGINPYNRYRQDSRRSFDTRVQQSYYQYDQGHSSKSGGRRDLDSDRDCEKGRFVNNDKNGSLKRLRY